MLNNSQNYACKNNNLHFPNYAGTLGSGLHPTNFFDYVTSLGNKGVLLHNMHM